MTKPLTPSMKTTLRAMVRPQAETFTGNRGSLVRAIIPGAGNSWYVRIHGRDLNGLVDRGLIRIIDGDHLNGWVYGVTADGRAFAATMQD